MYSDRKSIYEQIISSIDIVELISEDLELSKKGNNYVGLCPFHSDNNPSFTVSPDKKIYKCFVCEAGGNAISYYQNFHKLSYNETIKQLAKRIGIEVNLGPEVKKESMHYLLEEVMNFYGTTLTVINEGREAKDYLFSRGYTLEDIDFYKLGYAASNLNLRDYLENLNSDKFSKDEINTPDLFNQNQSMFFNNRLMIPIMDDLGRVVGFSGRVLKEDNIKYLNSRDSDTFRKGDVLFNLNNAKNYLKNNELILVEGFFDVFALRKLGYNNVIAIMGTAFTQNHLNLFRKYRVNKFTLCLDGDKPGIETTLKLGETLIKNGFKDLHCVNLKEYKDIDECIKNTPDYNIENNITSFVEYKINNLQSHYNLNSLDGKKQFIDKCLEGLNVTDTTYTKLVAATLSKITEIDLSVIMDLISSQKQTVVQNLVNNYVETPPRVNNIPQQPYVTPQVVVEQPISQKYQDLIVYMLKSQKYFDEIMNEINEQNINIDEIKKYVEKINNAYATLNVSNIAEYSLINNFGITFEFFEFLGDQSYTKFNEMLAKQKHKDITAKDLVNNINKKTPGINIARHRAVLMRSMHNNRK